MSVFTEALVRRYSGAAFAACFWNRQFGEVGREHIGGEASKHLNLTVCCRLTD